MGGSIGLSEDNAVQLTNPNPLSSLVQTPIQNEEPITDTSVNPTQPLVTDGVFTQPSKIEQAQNRLQDAVERNQQKLQDKVEQNQMKLDPLTADVDIRNMSRFDFVQKFKGGELNQQQLENLYFLRKNHANDQALEQAYEAVRGYAPRTTGEIAKDAALSLAQTPALIGEALYGIPNFLSGGELENATGLGGMLAANKEWLNSFQTNQTKYQREHFI
jgi:hypothetical protein